MKIIMSVKSALLFATAFFGIPMLAMEVEKKSVECPYNLRSKKHKAQETANAIAYALTEYPQNNFSWYTLKAFLHNNYLGMIQFKIACDCNEIQFFKVEEPYRNKGIGRELFCQALEIIRNKNRNRDVYWQPTPRDKRTELELIEFYKRLVGHIQNRVPGILAVEYEEDFFAGDYYLKYHFCNETQS